MTLYRWEHHYWHSKKRAEREHQHQHTYDDQHHQVRRSDQNMHYDCRHIEEQTESNEQVAGAEHHLQQPAGRFKYHLGKITSGHESHKYRQQREQSKRKAPKTLLHKNAYRAFPATGIGNAGTENNPCSSRRSYLSV